MMTNIQTCLKEASQQLSTVVDGAFFEAEILLAHALQVSRSYLHTWPEKAVSDKEIICFMQYIRRRFRQEPIAYITGKKEFWSLPLSISKDTLIPRPETELLVESALAIISPNRNDITVADLGTGSGAIALALASERPLATICATDVCPRALQVARENAQALGPMNVSFYLGNWCTGLPYAHFDVIVSNPPYVAETEWEAYADGLAFEPKHALLSGKDGLDAISTIIQMAKNYLQPGGHLLIEHGFRQAELVRKIFIAAGYKAVSSKRDFLGHERVTGGQYQ